MTAWISLVTGGAGAIVVMASGIYMFATGKLHSDKEFSRLLKSYENEVEGHERTREALALANARAEAGMKPAEIIAAVLSSQQKSIGR